MAGDRTKTSPARFHDNFLARSALLLALSAACAGSTKKNVADNSALAELPGRWDNGYVEIKTADGAMQMHYVAAGPKDAPRVILLHGFPDFSYTWREVVPLLVKDYRVLAPDLRGYAASDKPKSGYDLDTLAADVLAFADAAAQADGAAADAPTHLVGHDWGAAIGWWTVLKAPKRFATYTAISVAHPRAFTEFLASNEEQRKKSKYMKRLTLPLVPTFFAGMSDKKRREVYSEGLTRKDAFGDSQLIWYRTAFDSRWETRGPLRYYKERFRNAKANEKAAADAPKITIPVLVLWGKLDKYLMWEMAQDSCKYVEPGQCEVQVFDEAGHWVHWDNPTGVVQRWRQFVAAERLGEPAREPAELESVAPAPPT
jgi:pimeloyl-ACP methyl ester carboxylesterase